MITPPDPGRAIRAAQNNPYDLVGEAFATPRGPEYLALARDKWVLTADDGGFLISSATYDVLRATTETLAGHLFVSGGVTYALIAVGDHAEHIPQ